MPAALFESTTQPTITGFDFSMHEMAPPIPARLSLNSQFLMRGEAATV